jgi:hypothetical protein
MPNRSEQPIQPTSGKINKPAAILIADHFFQKMKRLQSHPLEILVLVDDNRTKCKTKIQKNTAKERFSACVCRCIG